MGADSVDLVALGADVEWTDAAAADQARATGDRTLGRLGEIGAWLAAAQGRAPARAPQRTRCVVFGAARPELTAQADSLGVGVRAVPGDEVSVPDAVAGGVAMADAEVDGGADLVVVAAPDASAVPALVVSVLTGAEPVALLPRGAAATDTAAWIARAEYLRDTRRGVAALRHEPGRLLIATGDVVLAMVTGFVLRAVARRTPLLLDGAAAAAAALIAYRVQPRAGRWWRFADRSADPVHVRVTRDLEQVPILDLGTTAGDGTVGLLAVPLVRAAVPSADGASDA